MLAKSTLSPIVDLGRALAVTAIFYFHVGVNTHYPLSQYGHYAVGFFIVLAGVAYMNFSRTRVTDLRTCLHYFFNRLWALFPIFLAVNLLIFAASYVYPSGLGRPYSLGELLLSSLGLSQYFGYRYLSVVMWFVPFILQVYLLLPLVEWLFSRVRPLIVLVAAFLLFFARIIPVCVCFPHKAEEICVNWSPIFRLPEVVLGVYLGMVFGQNWRLWRGGVFVAAYAAASICQMEAGKFLAMPDTVAALPWAGFVVGLLISVAAALLFVASSRSVGLKNFRLLGNASFPFFLIHGVAIRFVYAKFGANGLVWLGYYTFCWIVAVILAMADRRLRTTKLPWGSGRV